MKLEKIKEKLNNMVVGIANTAIDTSGRVPKFWQLYLDASVELGLDIVDTCATSQCLSVLAKAGYCDSNIINNAVSSVVRLRNQQGSWPSAITVDELEFPDRRRQGDTAIGDNCFALTALIDADFLSEQFQYDSLLSNDLKSLYSRVVYVSEAVNWLFENKAQDNLGWYYTDEKTNDNQSVTLTTLNVLQVLSKILYCLNKCCIEGQLSAEQKQYCTHYANKIITIIKQTVSIITDQSNIYDNIQNDWKAIGTSIRCVEPSIIHTCKLINLLLYNKQFNNLNLYSDINDLARYIIDNATSSEICEGFYFEYYYLHKFTSLGFPARTIQVDHENYAEAIVLYTLINMRLNGITVQEDIIEKTLNATINQMDPIVPNFYRCRSKRAQENNFWQPVYASYEAYTALSSYVKSYDANSAIDNSTNIVDLAIQRVKTWINNHSAVPIATITESEYVEIIAEFDTIPTNNDDEKSRIRNAQTFLRLVQNDNPQVTAASISEFKDFITELATQICAGSLKALYEKIK